MNFLFAFLCGLGAYYASFLIGMEYNLPLVTAWLAYPVGIFFFFAALSRFS